jgi:hypothetical protein
MIQEKQKFIYYSLCLYFVFVIFLSITGYFSIGLLSDDYAVFNAGVNSTLYDKFAGTLPFTNEYHLRPIVYISFQVSSFIHDALGFSYDNFIFYRFQNLIVYLLIAFFSGYIVFKNKTNLFAAIVIQVFILFYPNNLHSICWTTGRFELILTLFYILSAMYAVNYAKEKKPLHLFLYILFAVLALLTKETAVSLPVTGIILFYYYSKKLDKRLLLFSLVNLSMFLFYILYKYSIHQGLVFNVRPGTVFILFAEAVYSLILPVDYLTIQNELTEFNIYYIIFASYILIFIIFLFVKLKKLNNARDIILIFSIFTISVLPNIYAGYFRPQLILLPFCLFLISGFLILTYFNYRRLTIILSVLFFLLYLVMSASTMHYWEYAYKYSTEYLVKIKSIAFAEGLHKVVIGSPGRVKQSFVNDKLTGAYNYWKYDKFVLNDTINDAVLTGALDLSSLKAELKMQRLNSGEIELSTTGTTQYFYIEGYSTKQLERGIQTADYFVRAVERNHFNKSTKLKIKFTGNASVFIWDPYMPKKYF